SCRSLPAVAGYHPWISRAAGAAAMLDPGFYPGVIVLECDRAFEPAAEYHFAVDVLDPPLKAVDVRSLSMRALHCQRRADLHPQAQVDVCCILESRMRIGARPHHAPGQQLARIVA